MENLKKCPVCNNDFNGIIRNGGYEQVYCSVSCRNKASNKRKILSTEKKYKNFYESQTKPIQEKVSGSYENNIRPQYERTFNTISPESNNLQLHLSLKDMEAEMMFQRLKHEHFMEMAVVNSKLDELNDRLEDVLDTPPVPPDNRMADALIGLIPLAMEYFKAK